MRIAFPILVVIAAMFLVGCQSPVVTTVPDNAPIWLSSDIEVTDPFAWVNGQRVQVHGRVRRHAGDFCCPLPATQPTNPVAK